MTDKMRSRKAYRMNMDNRKEIQSTLPSRPAENLPNLPARHWLKAGRCVSRPVPGCLARPISAHAHLRLGSNVHARRAFSGKSRTAHKGQRTKPVPGGIDSKSGVEQVTGLSPPQRLNQARKPRRALRLCSCLPAPPVGP